MQNKKGQVTIFIIIAVVIVAAVASFLIFRESFKVATVPASIQPVYNSFLSCLEDKTKTGIDVLESQAGYIQLPEFEPGNADIPFSSQLTFLGNPIPYWYYISGSNIQKEQIPSQADMEKSLEDFIDERIRECDYESYYQEGFEITQGEPKASISIGNGDVRVKLNMNMQITKGEDNALVENHEVTVKSNLGALYNSAKTLYNKEQKELFLENYGVDNLRLYAPVDGVELTCSPKTWDAEKVFEDLKEAIETNTLALTTKSPSTKDGKYFFINANLNGEARFINSRNWSSSFEVLPSEGSLLIANPVGNQQGLGILGFCYVTHHFVYNVKYPILIQIINGNEIFQFPVVVVIQGNKARTAMDATAGEITANLCPYKNTPATVRTYDTNLNPINSLISYECFEETCYIGETSSGELTADFPQCVNGYVIARAEGFVEARQRYSTTQTGNAEIIMNKLYDLNLKLKLNNADYNGKAMVYFNSEVHSAAVSYPEQKKIKLAEGDYNISVYIYKDASMQLQATTQKQCMTVPSSGIGGILGISEKKCFDITIPSQMISSTLAGGGTQRQSILESDLKNSNTIEINSEGFGVPTTIEQLQNNYLLFDEKGLGVNLK